jgi:hypothetical protein
MKHRKGRRHGKRRGGASKASKKEVNKVEKFLGISKSYKDVVRMVPLTLGYTSTPWPRHMRTQMKVVTSAITGTQTAFSSYSWYLNSFGDGTSATNGCGPQVDFAMAFAKNYPAGLKGIIQTQAPGGSAICPYNLYRIRRARIFVDVIPAPITAGVAPSGEVRIALFPSVQASFLGTSYTAVCEQPYCNFKAIANPIFGTATTTAITGGGALSGASRIRMKSFGSVGRLFGVPPSAVENNDDYRGTVATGPTDLAYFHLVLIGDGGSYNCNIEATVVYDVEFYGLNNLSSAQNN